MTHRPLTPILLATALAACGDAEADRAQAATVDTLPNGALVVHNSGESMWDSAATWRFVEETRIGSMEGDGPDVFAEVRDIDVDALGRVWILDPQSKTIRVFEADGAFVRTVGRGGAGPGEIEDANGIEFDPYGRLWVQDAGNQRYTLYDTTGAFITTKRRESNLFTWTWMGAIATGGRVFDVDIVMPTEPDGETRQVLLERDSAGAVRDTFELPEYDELVYEWVSSDGRSRSMVNVPFAPGLSWRVARDGALWFGVNDDYRLIRRSAAGDTLLVVEKEWTPLPVRPEDVDSILGQGFYAELAERGADMDRSLVPSTRPAWEFFWIDDDGYLWVRLPRENGAPERADVFDPDGYYQGTVTLPEGMSRWAEPVVRGDRYYAVLTDEFDVAYVVTGRIAGREAGRLESAR
ncbi:MAG TPA: 6-bladed beta-propeller [Longimicrobiales bacterium]